MGGTGGGPDPLDMSHPRRREAGQELGERDFTDAEATAILKAAPSAAKKLTLLALGAWLRAYSRSGL